MVEIQGTAASRGYVRAVFSQRWRGFALPLDLVRAHLRAVRSHLMAVDLCDCAGLASDGDALRARLAAEFGGYLVSECADDAALRNLEIYGRKYATKELAFSQYRAGPLPGAELIFMTGGRVPLACDWWGSAGLPLDAPDAMPAGACEAAGDLFDGARQIAVYREPLPEPFTDRREYWVDYVGRQEIGRSGPAGAGVKVAIAFRGRFVDGSIDAPEHMAAGSCRWLDWKAYPGKGFPAMRLMLRGSV